LLTQQKAGASLVAGHTFLGGVQKYYDAPPPSTETLISLARVPEVAGVTTSSATSVITAGAAATIAQLESALTSFTEGSSSDVKGNAEALLRHISRVAHPQVRNVGSLGGNLMMAIRYPKFCSDLHTILAGAGASAVLMDAATGTTKTVELAHLAHAVQALPDPNLAILVSLAVPLSGYVLRTGKVALRRENAHAYMNVAVRATLAEDRSTIAKSRIFFGGVKLGLFQAAATAEVLDQTSLVPTDHDVQLLLQAAALEAVPDPALGKVAMREKLVQTMLFRARLGLVPTSELPPQLVTAAAAQPRPVSSGSAVYDGADDPGEFPVSKPITKLSAPEQTSGKAVYTTDVKPKATTTLHAALVTSTVASATLVAMDASAALATDGVVAFHDAKALKALGLKNELAGDVLLLAEAEVVHHGQPLGIIVASSQRVALEAAALVKVTYADVSTSPILTLDDAIAKQSFFNKTPDTLSVGDADAALKAADVTFSGEVRCGHQYHFYMETQNACAERADEGNGVFVHSSTQNPSMVQSMVSAALGIGLNEVEVAMRRSGGGFGGKITKSTPVAVAAACALAATPAADAVRLHLPIGVNMQALGSRRPHLAKYTVGVDRASMKVTAVKMEVYFIQGATTDLGAPVSGLHISDGIDNAYNIKNWHVDGWACRTNTPPNTAMRSPGFLPATFMIESIMEHAALTLGADPLELRRANFYAKGDVTPGGQTLSHCSIDKVVEAAGAGLQDRRQEVAAFNAANRWVKRGLSLVPVKYGIGWEGANYNASVAVYADGTVIASHSGCEIGQGIDVKVAQVAAKLLGCPLELIRVAPVTTATAVNTTCTGGSQTSENNAQAMAKACEVLNARLEPFKMLDGAALAALATPADQWKALVSKAVQAGVDLQAAGYFHGAASKDGPFQYESYAAAVVEAEVDCLTGEVQIPRADFVMDCGTSLSPLIDLGQAQGGFVLGTSYFVQEEFAFDPESGALVTNGTWEYKPAMSKDIPVVFNVSLLPNAPNPSGYMGSKASGEPPLTGTVAVLLAIRSAIDAARGVGVDAAVKPLAPMSAPATPERVMLALDIQPSQLRLPKEAC